MFYFFGKQDIFEDIIRYEEESDVPLSGASVEVAHAAKKPRKGTIAPQASKFKCNVCAEEFEARHKFEKHTIEHKLQGDYFVMLH